MNKLYTLAAAALMACSTYTAQAAVITAPEGEAREYTRSGYIFMQFWGETFSSEDGGFAGKIVWNGDKVYMCNPCFEYGVDTYIEGTKADGKVTFKFPQEVGGNLYANRMTRTSAEGETPAYKVDSANNEISFTLAEDGSLTMDTDDSGSVILGLARADNTWYGHGDFATTWTPFNDKLIEAPAAQAEAWTLAYDGNARRVMVAFEGSDVYIQGISAKLPKAWIKGTLEGDSIRFASRQYLGISPTYDYRSFFVACTSSFEYSQAGLATEVVDIIPELVMAYDAQAGTITATSKIAIVGGIYDSILHEEIFANAVIRKPQAGEDFTPANPSIVEVRVYDSLP